MRSTLDSEPGGNTGYENVPLNRNGTTTVDVSPENGGSVADATNLMVASAWSSPDPAW